MRDFTLLKNAVQNKLKEMEQSGKEFFETNVSKDEMWDAYLEAFPSNENKIFRKRREYDCSCCRHFIKQIGNVVVINDDLTLTSIWDVETGDEVFDKVCSELSETVKSAPIIDVFRTKFDRFGQDFNWDNEEDIKWEHFVYEVPNKFKSYNVPMVVGLMRDRRFVFYRSLEEITKDAYSEVLDLINDNVLYRGAEYKYAVETMFNYKKKFDKLSDEDKKNFSWLNGVGLSDGVAKIRNTAIGTLLIDLSEGIDLETAVKKYENVVAPMNYKRPKALFTKKMLEEAKNTVVELGYNESLDRRFATLNDVSVDNVLFADRTVKNKDFDSFFDMLEDDVVVNAKKINAEDISADDFINKILPKSTSTEILFENRHVKNLVSMITSCEPTAKSMFKWDNNFSWAYKGNIADSLMKSEVAKKGGDVTGDLRFSIMWNDDKQNLSDLDAHCVLPNRKEIYFGKGHIGCGKLDVDIIDPCGIAVENITFSDRYKMEDGTYNFFVNYYSPRTGYKNGFKAEIEFDGEVYEFEFNGEPHKGRNVCVAKVVLKNGEFTIKPALEAESNTTSTKHWGVGSNKFIPVSLVSYSPNYWGNNSVGNKHLFFMLKGCVNDEEPNAFYNEYLKDELVQKHKRVFEALGSKAHVKDCDNQLSGLGFSMTKRDSVIVKCDNKVYKVQF